MGPSTALAAPTHGAVAAAEHSQDDASTSNLAKGRTRVSPLHGGSGNDTLQCFARSIMQLGVPQTQGSGGGGAGPGHGQGDKNRSRPRQHGGTQRPTPEGGQQPRAGIPAPRMQGVNAAGGAAGVPRDASLAPSSAEEGPAKKPRRKRAGGRGDGFHADAKAPLLHADDLVALQGGRATAHAQGEQQPGHEDAQGFG